MAGIRHESLIRRFLAAHPEYGLELRVTAQRKYVFAAEIRHTISGSCCIGMDRELGEFYPLHAMANSRGRCCRRLLSLMLGKEIRGYARENLAVPDTVSGLVLSLDIAGN